MKLFNIPITWELVSKIILVVSLLINLAQYRYQRKQSKFKIDKANEEIMHKLIQAVRDKMIPSARSIQSVINETSKKYRLRKRKLNDITAIYDRITAEIYANWALKREERVELLRLAEKEMLLMPPKKRVFVFLPKIFKLKKYTFGELNTEIEAKVKKIPEEPVEKQTLPQKKMEIFSDDFERFVGWNKYKEGQVSQSNDFFHTGSFSLKKDLFGDANGGWKEIGRNIDFEEGIKKILFSGWIYRPSVPTTSHADRLAIEDANSSGYGFCVNHLQNLVSIERRDNGRYSLISIPFGYKPPKDTWYEFEFCMMPEGKHVLYIYDDIEGIEVEINSFIDNKYLFFNRIAIHGGFPFYVDDLKVEIIE